MKKAAVACCGDRVVLHFTPEGIDLSQHRRYRYLLRKSLIYSDCGLLPAHHEWHLLICFWFTWVHLNQCPCASMLEPASLSLCLRKLKGMLLDCFGTRML